MKPIIITNKGKRKVNEDYVLAQNINSETLLMIVADGMGGYEYGDLAAKLVVENIFTYLSTVKQINSNHIQKSINKATLAIRQLRDKKQAKIGATVGGIVFMPKIALCFWVGDVKIFHFRDEKLQFESNPHTLINEVKKNGSINDTYRLKKYRHVVTRSVQGDIKNSQVETKLINDLTQKDTFIVSSDGVHNIIDGLSLQNILYSNNDLNEGGRKIEERLILEAIDNFSMIVLQCN